MALVPILASASCWEEAGRNYAIDPLLLQAIGWKESRGWSHAVGPMLKDGHQALGVMQINTSICRPWRPSTSDARICSTPAPVKKLVLGS